MGIFGGGGSWDDNEDIKDDDGSMFGGSDRYGKRLKAKQILKESGEEFDLKDIDRYVLENLSED